MARSPPGSSGARRESTLDRTLFYHRHPHTFTHLDWRQCRYGNSSHVHIFGMQEETRVSGENSCSHGVNMKTSHSALAWNYFFPHQCYNKCHWIKRYYSRTCYTTYGASTKMVPLLIGQGSKKILFKI